MPAPDRPPLDGDDLHDTIRELAGDRDREARLLQAAQKAAAEVKAQLDADADARNARDQRLRDALRKWGASEFGTVDAFCVEVAGRTGHTVAHVKNDLTYPKGGNALDAAVKLFRERAGESEREGAERPALPEAA